MKQQGVEEAISIRTERQAEEGAVGSQEVAISLRSSGVGVTESNFTAGTRADRLSTSGSLENDLWHETDTHYLYRWTGTAWQFVTGIYGASDAARLALSISAADNGAFFVTTDTKRLYQISAGAWALRMIGSPLNKFDATAAPAVTDDSGDGYEVGSQWVDVTLDDAYVCVDASVGAAVWKKTTP